ncbi:MAG: hypothetical protein MMC33_008647 [Icmadophila ericetorum]|nr:hypothetical protein [Icmadophila ericetorum]
MTMSSIKKNLAGPGFIILNTIRAMNITSLLAVVVASAVMLVKTFVVSKFFFFDAVSHVVTAFLGFALIISETSLFRKYFERNWPLLSLTSGFVTLGFLMIIVGVSILGNLNKAATSQQSLGVQFWQIVISSGIVTTIMGFVNLFASYIFGNRKKGITARMVRSYGAQAEVKVDDVYRSVSVTRTSPRSGRKSFFLGRNNNKDVLPSYNASASSPRSEMSASNSPVSPIRGLNISGPITSAGPYAPGAGQFSKFDNAQEVQRPESTAHPALRGGRF